LGCPKESATPCPVLGAWLTHRPLPQSVFSFLDRLRKCVIISEFEHMLATLTGHVIHKTFCHRMHLAMQTKQEAMAHRIGLHGVMGHTGHYSGVLQELLRVPAQTQSAHMEFL